MGNKQAKKTNQLLDDQLTTSNRDYGALADRFRGRLGGAEAGSDELRDMIISGYGSFLTPGASGGGGGRGVAAGPGRTWGRSEIPGIRGDIGALRAFGANPISDESKARVRGGGVYDEFSQTGGLSEGDRSNIRSRSIADVRSTFDELLNQNARRQASSGGLSPGYDAQTAKMARDAARASSSATLDTELGITDAVNRGRQWGAEGMTSSESALNDYLMNAILGSYGTSGELGLGLMSNILASDQAQAADARAGEAAGAARSSADASQRLAALAGLSGLYESTPGEVGMYNEDILRTYGQRGGEAGELIGTRAAYNPNRSFMDQIAGVLGPASAIAAPFLAPKPRRPLVIRT